METHFVLIPYHIHAKESSLRCWYWGKRDEALLPTLQYNNTVTSMKYNDDNTQHETPPGHYTDNG